MKSDWSAWLVLACAPALPAADVPAYTIQTVAGSSFMGDGGPATAAQIGPIQGVAADAKGNLYLSDTDHNCVRKVDKTTGIIATVAGAGTAGFSGDGGPAGAAQLNLPYGLVVDPAGDLYIADYGNNRVRMVDTNGIITTIAGNGAASHSGDCGKATLAQLYAPRNLALDSAGNLYISEFESHCVRMVTPATAAPPRIIYTFAGTGSAGYSGDNGLATAAQLNFPSGLAVDRYGALYIADSRNNRVRKVAPNGIISTVVSPAVSPNMAGPTGVAVDQSLTIYVASPGTDVFFLTAGGLSWVLGFGLPGGQTLSGAGGLAIDPVGDLFIADGMQIWEMNAAGIALAEVGGGSPATLVAGDGYLTAVGDGTPATSAILYQPSAVAFDTSGNLFIADTGTERVRIVLATGLIQTLAGDGLAGYNTDGVAATSAKLNAPMGLAMDPWGNLFVADTYNSRVREITAGIISTFAGTGPEGLGPDGSAPAAIPLGQPHGVCTGSDGSVYIVDTDNNRVLVVPPAGGVPPNCAATAGGVAQPGCATTFAGNGGQGNAGDGYLARFAELNQPTACALDGSGNLFIADTNNHSIREVTASTAVIATVAGTGAPGFSGDGGAATSAALDFPKGVAADSYGNIFIADTGNHAIRLVTPDTLIHTIAGRGGISGFSGDDGAAVNALLNSPSGLLLDGAGDLYFADSGNNRVRRLTPGDAVAVGPAPVGSALALVNAASQAQGSVAPGEIVTIYGLGIGPGSGVTGSADAPGLIGGLLAGVQVFFDGVPAPLFYVQATQINAQAPYTIAGENFTQVAVSYQGQLAGTLNLAVAPSAPALFAAALNQDGSLNSSGTPAARGTVVTFFGTGEGLTNGANIAGQAAAAPYPIPALPVTLTVAGVAAQLLYAGEAPGFAGLLQVDAVIPGGFVPSGPVPVQLVVGVGTSPPITVWLQ